MFVCLCVCVCVTTADGISGPSKTRILDSYATSHTAAFQGAIGLSNLANDGEAIITFFCLTTHTHTHTQHKYCFMLFLTKKHNKNTLKTYLHEDQEVD